MSQIDEIMSKALGLASDGAKTSAIQFYGWSGGVLSGRRTVDETSVIQEQKGNAVFSELLAKIASINSIAGVKTKNEYDDLIQKINSIKDRIANNQDIPDGQKTILKNLSDCSLQLCQAQQLIEEVKQKDIEEQQKTTDFLGRQKNHFDSANQEMVNRNANMHLYRVLTMVMLGGALDFLDILGSIFDNFGGDFSKSVEDTLGDEGVVGPLAKINDDLGISKLFGKISEFPILKDFNQFVVDLFGSEYLSPFTSLAGNALGSEGAKMLFGGLLLMNRLYHEAELKEDWSKLKKESEQFLDNTKDELRNNIEKHQGTMANFIVGKMAQNAVDECHIKAYLKTLCRNNGGEIPDSFKGIKILKSANPDVTITTSTMVGEDGTIFDLVIKHRKKKPTDLKTQDHLDEENVADILFELNNNKELYNLLLKEANKWKYGSSISKGQSEEQIKQQNNEKDEVIKTEYGKLLDSMGVEESDKNGILTSENPEQKIKDLYENQNKEKVLDKIKTAPSPDTPSHSPQDPKAKNVSHPSAFPSPS